MCYFNGQRVTREEFIRLLALEREVKKYDFLNVGLVDGFTQTPLAVLVPSEDRTNFEIVPMEWGYIPAYNENRADVEKMRKGYQGASKWIDGKPNLNAKAENLFTSPSKKDEPSIFIEGVRKGRCLVLSTGFFEFRHIKKRHKKTGKLLESKEAYPYFVSMKSNEYFFMAGVYTPCTLQEDYELKCVHLRTFAF
jgi:putative SOS response-associated peptidase YedK